MEDCATRSTNWIWKMGPTSQQGGGGGNAKKISNKRSRNDSGMDEEECFQWEDTIRQWKSDLHSIVDQEADRMINMTSDLKSDLLRYGHDQDSRLQITALWKEKMREMIICTDDLIECSSNDIIESLEHQHVSSGSESLDDIPEEAPKPAYPGGGPIRHKFNRRRRKSSTDLKKMIKILLFAKTKRDFYSDLDKLKKNPLFREMKKKHHNNINMKKNNPNEEDDFYEDEFGDDDIIHWSDEEDNKENETAEIEDIFHDWIKLQNNNYKNLVNLDVNRIFWDISLETRARRLSQEIDDLPISDQPDVIIDRCESLEGVAEVPFKGRHKMYWNIFKAWRHNLIEEKKNRKNNARRIFNDYKCWYHHPNKYPNIISPNTKPIIEDYFNEWKWNLDDIKYRRYVGVRRPSEEFELPSPKKAKFEDGFLDAWNFIQEEIEPEYCPFRMEDQIRKAFDKYSDEDIQEKYKKSTEEFCRLRYAVRRRRSRRRSLSTLIDTEDWFQDSNWIFRENLNFASPDYRIERYFNDWRYNFKEKGAVKIEEIFQDWRRNHFNPVVIHDVPELKYILTSRFHFKPIEKLPREVAVVHNKKNKNRSITFINNSSILSSPCKYSNKLQNNVKAAKSYKHKIMKCLAKQPTPRGRG